VRDRGALRDALVLAALALWAAPFFWQALTSIKPDTALLAVERLLAAPPTLDHYRAVIQRSVMPAALIGSHVRSEPTATRSCSRRVPIFSR